MASNQGKDGLRPSHAVYTLTDPLLPASDPLCRLPTSTRGAHPLLLRCDLDVYKTHISAISLYNPSKNTRTFLPDLFARFAMKIQFCQALTQPGILLIPLQVHIIVLCLQDSPQTEGTDCSVRQVSSKMNKRSLTCDTFCSC